MDTIALLPPDAVARLALALVIYADPPTLLLDIDLKVIAASNSFCREFTTEHAAIVGRKVTALGKEWDLPQLISLLSATALGILDIAAYEMELKPLGKQPRHLVLNATKLDFGSRDPVLVLLTILDVTEARLADRRKDDLLREKAILLQEANHRMANSLQIISAILMQSASRAKADETRTKLYEAHHRVMSVAALQQHLAASRVGQVDLRPYLATLCRSIGASMIHDHHQLSLEVTTDDAVWDAESSISLGLIVTELIINALKHAFPGRRRGKINAYFHHSGLNWTLSVSDNGVGMPTDPESAKPGLGSTIVQALAKQLEATVHVAAAYPGTDVSIVHKQTADVSHRQPATV